MAGGSHFESLKIAISQIPFDFDEICTPDAHWPSEP